MKYCLLSLLVTVLSLSAFGQKQRSKGDLVKEISTLTKTNKPEDIAKAYEIGKEYVSRFGTETDETSGKIKKFVKDYRTDLFYKAVDGKDPVAAFKIGGEITAEEPDDTTIHINMAFAGFNGTSSGVKGLDADTIRASTNAIRLIGEGKLPAKWEPFADQEEALGWLHYFRAIANQNGDLQFAAVDMFKAVSFKSPVKASMDPYYFVAFYFEKVYEKVSKELNDKVAAKTISGEAEKAERARVDKCVDLMLDAYARAVNKAEATKNPRLGEVKDRYTQIYKFRKGTEMGMAQFYADINMIPMPDPSSFK